ncbi:hypothetical protein HY345_04180 [Candidatus Microgenomates bacterium]|nr:hypothetical protein [Candidatus Microgenomates bacterium]
MEFIKKFLHLVPTPESPKEIYLSLEFEEGLVKAAVWEHTGQNVKIVAEEREQYDGESDQAAIEACDKVVSRLERGKIDLQKVIFGIPFEWAQGNKIIADKQNFLKDLCSKLNLTPAGFVVIQEALTYYLQKEEGMPVTAILVQVLPTEIVLTISKIGKILGLVRKKREGLLGDVIVAALKDFPQIEVLPSRFLLYDTNKDLEEVRQELISFPWLQKIDFLHFPKIDILVNNVDLKAIVYAGVAEMTQEKEIKLQALESDKPIVKEFEKEQELLEEKIDETVVNNEQEINTSPKTISIEEIGFVRDEDIRNTETAKENISPPGPKTVSQESAFELDAVYTQRNAEKSDVGESTSKQGIPKESLLTKFTSLITKVVKTVRIPKIKFTRTGFSLPGFKAPSFLLIPVVILALLLVVGFALYWSMLKAEVILTVEPKEVTTSAEITVSPEAALLDEAKKIIPGKTIEVEESGKKTVSTTGVKNVGERAKGQVTLYNKTSSPKLFTTGTVISFDKLEFTLDSSASVSAQKIEETGTGATIVYGKQTVAVTAGAIGTKYNLGAGTKFQIEDFASSAYEAKNDQVFSGGSSKEISVVAKSDMDNLLATLSAELLAKGEKKLEANQSNQRLIKEVSDAQAVKKNYDKVLGTEGDQLTLDLTQKFSVLSYNDQDLKSIMGKLIDKEVPPDYSYSPNNIQSQGVVKKVNEDSTVLLAVSFKAKLIPKIDPLKIQKNLSGKSFSEGEKFLTTLKNVKSFEATITPRLPGMLYSFPRTPQNIKVEIKGQ